MRTLEEKRLASAAACLVTSVEGLGLHSTEGRIQILEAAAARLGGFDLELYHGSLSIRPVADTAGLLSAADVVVREVARTGLPPALALSALARESLERLGQRTSGAWHTDYRLALHLAARLAPGLTPASRVVDPASGSGMLLAALLLQACGDDRIAASQMVGAGLVAGDLSAAAVRGACLVLAAICGNVEAVAAFRGRCHVGDSLLTYGTQKGFEPGSFDAVIANPPWDKVKAARHEHLLASGVERHYGAAVGANFDAEGFERERRLARDRAAAIANRFPSVQGGEVDLYVAFTDLALSLLAPEGIAGLIVPGGLIRSQGTESLRRRILRDMEKVEIAIHDNKGAHFAVDSRLKFVTAILARGRGNRAPLVLRTARAVTDDVVLGAPVLIGRERLSSLRRDLTIPEVATQAEWALYTKLSVAGHDWSKPASPWHPDFCREVDMTRQRADFEPGRSREGLDLVEGRMVQPHRLGAKAHRDGEGRAAVWIPLPPGLSAIRPQFRISEKRLAPVARERSTRMRVGFCDVTGQTNERTMMSAIIRPGVACGNKVPTILFPNEPSEERLWLFAALSNSLVFDWMMRRVTTTTINYFVALSVPLPPVEPESLPGRRLVEIARELDRLDRQGASSQPLLRRIAALRADADALVAIAWGVNLDGMKLILNSFPLLDRGQPPLPGEARSTITSDLILSRLAARSVPARPTSQSSDVSFQKRVEEADHLGAVGYVMSEFVAAASQAGQGATNAR